MNIQFSAEEIAAEERRPKKKVAVYIGYAGTGYHGMQINHGEKTIEGDLFAAFVAAGAISKANADDPRKSSFMRCARTDKGVHAAGNLISLKLIVEDEDVVKKINDNLPPQIRVWGMQRTNNSFSSYTACDSRYYEFLLPSYSLLPPQPGSFMSKQLIEAAKNEGVYDEEMARLDDVKDFWEEVEEREIKPLLDAMDPKIRERVLTAIYDPKGEENLEPTDVPTVDGDGTAAVSEAEAVVDGQTKEPTVSVNDSAPGTNLENGAAGTAPKRKTASAPRQLSPYEVALREVKAKYVAAKRRYRITPGRLQKLQDALNLYVGTINFHNYTVLKSHGDPSATRHIKSFTVNPEPVQIRDTEWLSLKVHGQSFMMHQIRKMVAMAALVVRCGAPLDLITRSYEAKRISIPKAPGLGLLLERPVFESYSKKAKESYDKEPIDFAQYDKEIQEFKDREIYPRMFEMEEKENS